MNNSDAKDKFIVFKIADYFLALPISAVLKVIAYPRINHRDIETPGIVQIGRHAIAVCDLHQILVGSNHPQATRPFLLIALVLSGELFAIPLEEPPNLVEVFKTSLQALPQSFQHEHLQHLASHVAVISEEEKTFTIFLLNLNQSSSPRLTAAKK